MDGGTRAEFYSVSTYVAFVYMPGHVPPRFPRRESTGQGLPCIAANCVRSFR